MSEFWEGFAIGVFGLLVIQAVGGFVLVQFVFRDEPSSDSGGTGDP